MSFDPEAVREFERSGWERAAAGYRSSFATATKPFADALLDAAGVGRTARVLDVACGPGTVASRAVDRGAEAIGLDFSPAMLALGRSCSPAVAFDLGDAEALPYADNAFDAVVSNFGIHHVPRPQRALGEAYRVLRSGGRIAFTVWAQPVENVAWRLLFDAIARYGDPTASAAPAPGGGFGTAAHCVGALRQAGFTNCATQLVRATWSHAGVAELVAALRSGTARMAAMIAAQSSEAMPPIIADIERNTAPYRDGEVINVPIAAVIAAGTRS